MAFFFGFTPSQVDEMDMGVVFALLEKLKENKSAAGMRAIAKGLGV